MRSRRQTQQIPSISQQSVLLQCSLQVKPAFVNWPVVSDNACSAHVQAPISALQWCAAAWSPLYCAPPMFKRPTQPAGSHKPGPKASGSYGSSSTDGALRRTGRASRHGNTASTVLCAALATSQEAARVGSCSCAIVASGAGCCGGSAAFFLTRWHELTAAQQWQQHARDNQTQAVLRLCQPCVSQAICCCTVLCCSAAVTTHPVCSVYAKQRGVCSAAVV